jgi:hypothetical protein
MYMQQPTSLFAQQQFRYVIQCRFANVFFIPLKIFQNHIKFMTDSTTGTTSARSRPKECICLTCGEGTKIAIHGKF